MRPGEMLLKLKRLASLRLRPKRFVGLDIAEDVIRVVEIEKKAGEITVKRAHQYRVEEAGRLEGILANLAQEWDLKNATIIASLPRQQAVVRQIALPPSQEKELSDMVMFQAKKELPFPYEDAVFDYCVLQRAEDGSMKVILVAVQSEVLAEYLAPFEALGLRPYAVDLSSFALYRMLLFKEALSPERTTALLEVRDKLTEIVICRGQALSFTRSVSIGKDEIENRPQALTSALRLSFAAFEGSTAVSIDNILVTGSIPQDSRLFRTLGEDFGVAIHPFEAFSEISHFNYWDKSPGSPEPVAEEAAPYARALGLALFSVVKDAPAVNFLRPQFEARKRVKFAPLWKRAALCGVLVFLLLLLPFIFASLKSAKARATIAHISALGPEVENLRQMHSLLTQVKPWMRQDFSFLDVLRELTELFPEEKNIYLTRFVLNKDGALDISGLAKSQEEVFQLMDRLKASSFFSDTKFEGLRQTSRLRRAGARSPSATRGDFRFTFAFSMHISATVPAGRQGGNKNAAPKT